MPRVGELANKRVEVGASALASGEPLIGEVAVIASQVLDGDLFGDPHASPI